MEKVQEHITPNVNKWIIALTVILPTFIEIMDTSVVNVSLPHIQGGLNAGLDESTWVLTSYLVSNAVIIPITGFFVQFIWPKTIFNWFHNTFYLCFNTLRKCTHIGGSGACTDTSGDWRRSLQPISQAILLESFPKKEHGMAMAIFGMGVVLAPTIGPVVGGWITDNLSWRWVFLYQSSNRYPVCIYDDSVYL